LAGLSIVVTTEFTHNVHAIREFELPNVGVGPDPLSMADVIAAADFAVLLFLRDYHQRTPRNRLYYLPGIACIARLNNVDMQLHT